MTALINPDACEGCGALPAHAHDADCPVYLRNLRPDIEPAATNVIEALRRVIRDLPAIGKEGTGPSSQGSYKYRGIEQITRHAAPLFAKHGLVMAPNAIVWRPTREVTVGGKPNTDESLLVTYRVYGPGGVDDYIEVQAPGIGRDSSDKGSNKAMTAAYKYALTQMLTVADAKDDNDAHHDDADEPAPYEALLATKDQLDRVRAVSRALREHGVEVSETNDEGEARVLGVKVTTRRDDGKLWAALTEDEATKLIGDLNAKLADVLMEAGGDPAPPPEPAATPPPGAAEEIPAVLPPGAAAEAYTDVQRPGPTPEQAERAREAQEALATVAAAQVPSAELRGKITKVPADDEVMARTVEHVNGLVFSEVLAALEAAGLSVDGRPQQVRQRWADHLAAQVRERTAGEG